MFAGRLVGLHAQYIRIASTSMRRRVSPVEAGNTKVDVSYDKLGSAPPRTQSISAKEVANEITSKVAIKPEVPSLVITQSSQNTRSIPIHYDVDEDSQTAPKSTKKPKAKVSQKTKAKTTKKPAKKATATTKKRTSRTA
jgi:hypothetical protein